jgi:4-hydroxy-tetrahydrodipicolinate synthase
MTGNLAPREMAIISKPWTEPADAAAFKEQYLRLLPLMHFNYSAINPVALKSLMKACGLPVGSLRKPLRNLDQRSLAEGLRIVRELGLDTQYGYRLAH